jgi:hypothetical protein
MGRGQIAIVAASAAIILACVGCEEDVAAPPDPQEAFSMYGILNPRLNTQTLGVSPVEPLLRDYTDSIDAVVTSTDMETGESVSWTDSVVVGERGQRDHIFVAAFRPAFGHTYRVDAVRSDGSASSALARIPSDVDVSAEDRWDSFIDIHIRGDGFHLLSIDVFYGVRYYHLIMTSKEFCEESPADAYAVSYTGKEDEVGDGYTVFVDLERDYGRVEAMYSAEHVYPAVPGRSGLALMGMSVRLLVADKSWDPPNGTFDENTLAQPGVMSNVANGFGLVAGGYNETAGVYPSEEAVGASPFFDYVMRPPNDCFDYCSCGRG